MASKRMMTAGAAMLLLLAVPLVAAPAPTVLGQVATGLVRVDGVAVPSGTTLISPSLVATGRQPSLIYFDNGQVVALGPQTTAHLEKTADDLIRASVRSGSLLVKRQSGEIATVATNHTVLVNRDGAQDVREGQPIQEGKRIGEEQEEQVGLCRLVEWSPERVERCAQDYKRRECDWTLIKVPASEVPAHLAAGDVYPGVDNNPYELDSDCRESKRGGGWFGTREKVIVGLFGAVAAAVVIEENNNDHQNRGGEPTSPFTP